MSFHVPNDFRIRKGPLASDESFGNNGAFKLTLSTGEPCYIIVSDKAMNKKDPAWEHVSVSMKDRNPTWDEMCEIKAIFWDEEDCVVQYHPPKSDYVNIHPYCLHLWAPVGFNILRPPSIMVGPK
jgi:hypothetical protein